jgi:trans-aconitate methyltransferase
VSLQGQHWCASDYARHARFVSDLGAPLLALLAAQPGERILDLGCGDGALTGRIKAAGADVVGVDGSADMVLAARARGLDARIMDGQKLCFHAAFDAVFSNAALHWMPDADAVLAGVARACKPGARFVGEMGGHGNVAAIGTALRAVLIRHGAAPERIFRWYFPTAQEYVARLTRAGFAVHSIELLPRPTLLPTGMEGWLATFSAPLVQAVPQELHATVLAETAALLAPALRDETGRWIADYVRLRFMATL